MEWIMLEYWPVRADGLPGIEVVAVLAFESLRDCQLARWLLDIGSVLTPNTVCVRR
jgi:hypothetical protein